MAPGDRMIAHATAAVAALVQALQHPDVRAGVGAVVVPLVGARPGRPEVRGRGVRPVLGPHGGPLDRRMVVEPGPHELPVVGPVVLGVGGRVHADVAAPAVHVRLEGGLLVAVQHVAGRAEEHHRLVLGQVARAEGGRVLGGVHGEVIGRAQVADGLDPGGDRVVPEAGRLGEHQHLDGGALGGEGGEHRRGEADRRRCQCEASQRPAAAPG